MKYFTKELWADLQDRDKSQDCFELWEAAFADYRAQLDMLQSRLTATAFEFFTGADVHDGALLRFVIADGDRETSPVWRLTPREHDDCHSPGYPVAVELEVAESSGRTRWRLAYSGVRRVLVDFPSERPMFYDDGDGFNDWGYHELTEADHAFLRHEVLFSSGAALLTEFREITVTKLEHHGRATSSD